MTLVTALDALLPAGLVLLMLTAGLRLPVRDLASVLRRPRALGLGLAVQVVTLPAAAFLLSRAFGLSPEMAIGLMLVAAAPGGVTSNYICLLVRADVALSAAMTLCTTLLCSLTIPLVLTLSGTGLAPDVEGLGRISLSMACIAFAPLLAGLALRHAFPGWSARARCILEPMARLVFLAVVVATIGREWNTIYAHLGQVGPACLSLNLVAILLGTAVGALGRLPIAQRRAIVVEASLQNVAVTIFVASSVLSNPAFAIPGLVYVLAMNLTALVQIGLVQLHPQHRTVAV